VARGDTVEQVRELAQELGVSERTIYRRFKAIRARGEASLELFERDLDKRSRWTCNFDGVELPADATIRREYCDDACRQAAFRARRRRERS
jgi:AcrR family transcriptional regulator